MDDFLSGKYSLRKSPAAFLPEADLEPHDLESKFKKKDGEIQQAEAAMSISLLLLRQAEKGRVLLDALKNPDTARLRKEVARALARVVNRPERDIQALPDEEKALLFGRHSYKLENQLCCMVMAAALTGGYFAAANQLLDQVGKAPAQAPQLFENFRDRMPPSLWHVVLIMAERERSLSSEQRAACGKILELIPPGERPSLLPFTVGDPPRLNALERHLLELHLQDPAQAKPLVSALAELNPGRAENWLLFGIIGSSEPPARSATERAWHLAGQLYRWGEDLKTADVPFDATALKSNADAIRLLFSTPQLAPARELVGEYLIRQLAEARESALLLEVLPLEMFRRYEPLLSSIVQIETRALAEAQQVDQVRALLERFPCLKSTPVVALALRRSGQFESALASLRDSSDMGTAERALNQARIANAIELELPELPEPQRELAQRLKPIAELPQDFEDEIRYCKALYALLTNDREEAQFAFEDLEMISLPLPKRKAYQLLLALQAQDSDLIDQSVVGLDLTQAEEMLAFIPGNLLRTAIRALTLASKPETVQRLAGLLYQHLPEALDPLLTNEELLAGSPALVQRLMDKTESNSDIIQRWAGYQHAVDLAAALGSPDLVARAVDGCLAMEDPLLAPHQIRLLVRRIPQVEDLDLRELLIERLTELSFDEARPFLYQLLHTYLGNQRNADASRIVQTLRGLGESSADLDQCARVLQTGATGIPQARSDRLPRPVSVGFYGGDTNHKARTDQLRAELMSKHPGLTIEFDHSVWNPNNLASLVQSVAKFDVVVASNLMRTDISRGIRQRARELNKSWGYCRNQGLGTITNSILNAVSLHLARKS